MDVMVLHSFLFSCRIAKAKLITTLYYTFFKLHRRLISQKIRLSMKRLLILSALFCAFLKPVKSQDSGLEKSIFGIQTGFIGVDIYNEYKLSDRIVLRSEASLFAGFRGGIIYSKNEFAMFPGVTIQPKYYYNLKKRIGKGKNIKNNAADYFSMQFRYFPNWFVISNSEDISVINQMSIIPTIGVRRNFFTNFNFEAKIGYGYYFSLEKQYEFSGLNFDLGVKLGYDF